MAIILGDQVRILRSTPSVNGLAVASTPIFTAPAGRKVSIEKVVVRVTAHNGVSVPPTAQVEIGAATGDVFASDLLTGLLTTDTKYTFDSQGKSLVVPAGQTVSLNITVGGTGTTLTLSVEVLGVFLN